MPILAVGLGAGGCAWKQQRDQLQAEKQQLTEERDQLAGEKAKLADELKSRKDETVEMNATLDEVQRSLEEVRAKELKIIKKSLDVAREGATPASHRERLQAEIATIRQTIRQNLGKLARLEKEKKLSGEKMATLQRLADELKKQLEEKDSTIAALQTRVLDLSHQVDTQASLIKDKDDSLQQKDGVIEERTRAMNTAYVAVAAKKVLRQKGVIDKKGAVLGLGGRWTGTGKFDPEVFRTIDTTKEAELTIPAAAKKVQVLPGHPKESYELVAAGPKSSTLKVTDADAFWKESRTLVVMLPD